MSVPRTHVPALAERLSRIRTLDSATRTVTPPLPQSAKIELSSRCDMQCFFCAAHKHARTGSDMSQALFTRLADELRMVGVEQLGLFYLGESMLCEWLPEAIRYAKEVSRFPYVFLTTNGLSATPDRLRACMASGLDSIKFAFNWSDEDEFQRVTGVPGAEYDVVLDNLTWARSIRDDVQHETGHRCAIYASSLRYDDEEPQRMKDTLKTIEACVDHHYWLPLLGHCGLPRRDLAGRPFPVKNLPCWALFTEAHITCDGNLSACPLDASKRFHVGDLEEMSFVEAWHSGAFQALRRHHLDADVKGTACQSCIAY